MKTLYVEGVATHDGPESCVGVRKGVGEASTGVRAGPVLSREIKEFGVPTLSKQYWVAVREYARWRGGRAPLVFSPVPLARRSTTGPSGCDPAAPRRERRKRVVAGNGLGITGTAGTVPHRASRLTPTGRRSKHS